MDQINISGTSSVSGAGPRRGLLIGKAAGQFCGNLYIWFPTWAWPCIVFSHAPAKIWQWLETLDCQISVQLPALDGQRPLDAAKHPYPTVHRTAPTTKNYTAQNVIGADLMEDMSELKGPWSEADTCVGFMGIQRERVFHFSSKTNLVFIFIFNFESFRFVVSTSLAKNLSNNIFWFLRMPFIRASPN